MVPHVEVAKSKRVGLALGKFFWAFYAARRRMHPGRNGFDVGILGYRYPLFESCFRAIVFMLIYLSSFPTPYCVENDQWENLRSRLNARRSKFSRAHALTIIPTLAEPTCFAAPEKH